MEKRVLVAIFLSFLVLYVYQALVVKPVPKPASTSTGSTAGASATSTGERTEGNPPAPATAQTGSTPAVSGTAPLVPSATALVTEPSERDVTVQTDDVIAVLTNRGGRLKSLRLKHYLDPQTHQPQEIIERDLPNQPLPFSLETPDDQTTRTLNGALYAVSGAPASGVASGPVDLRFEYRDSGGIEAVKQFHFNPSSYVITFSATVRAAGQEVTPTIQWGPAVGDAGE